MPDIDSGIRRASSFPYKKDGKTIALEHKGKPRYGRHRRVDGYFFGARSEGAGTPSQTPAAIAPATSEAVLLPRAASLTADQAFYEPDDCVEPRARRVVLRCSAVPTPDVAEAMS